jgi:3-oxoacyl-[acyl-carrier-protein] synthase II
VSREVWITGVGILSCLGEGLDTHWAKLNTALDEVRPYDDKSFAPYIVHSLPPMSFESQIPKKGDQRQMELWQRIGVYAAGLALTDAGVAGKPDLLDHTDMIVAASSGERDINLDNTIFNAIKDAANPGAFLNEALLTGLRPTLFLAQLPNLLAGNISIVHGVTGSSRTFMGEEPAGVDALRVAHARIAAKQSEITIVGGAYHGARWDMILVFELANAVLKNKFAPVWDRGPAGGIALASLGAFLVLESPEHAQARGAKPRARLAAVTSDRNLRRPGDTQATLRAQWESLAPRIRRDEAIVLSGAAGQEPATSDEKEALAGFGVAVRSTGSHLGHGVEAQIFANLALSCAALERGAMFPSAGSADTGSIPAKLTQIVVSSVGHWRGEGLALAERID